VYGIMTTRLSQQTIPSRADCHLHLPHIMKFSGGRSSAALAFLMAENGQLRPERGDVILFANTSAEHPATYSFTRECKRRLEADFDLPFFWFEFCTVEDASRGQYVRRPSYRLVKDVAPRYFRWVG
jgi:3'-phosphoadenosine 5'-phosphosulfate sulfotransferase (PAPS reductase)/FAD synthetase